MIDTNVRAFERISALLGKIGDSSLKPAKRYIDTGKDGSLEKKWLQEAKISDNYKVSPTIGYSKIEFDDKLFILFYGIGLDSISLSIDHSSLIPKKINSGLLTIIIADTEIKFKSGIDSLYVAENISLSHEDVLYKGHSLSQMEELFEPVSLYLIPDNSVFDSSDPFQIMLYLLSLKKDELVLPFTEKILGIYRKISLELGGLVNFQNLFVSITSSNFKHAFLELYRCVEFLYPITFISELYDIMDLDISFIDFSELFEEALKWKPVEVEALEKLFEKNSRTISIEFTELLSNLPSWKEANPHKFYYNLRNSIVHYRANHEEFNLSNDDWVKFIQLNLNIIFYHYEENRIFLTK